MKIVVSGMGCVSAAGRNTTELAATLRGRKADGLGIPSLPGARFNCAYASEYPAFQAPPELLTEWEENTAKAHEMGNGAACGLPQEPETLTFFFLRKAAEEALQQAGWTAKSLREFPGLRIGVCVGTSVDASFNLFEFYREWRTDKTAQTLNRRVFERYLEGSLSDKLLRHYGLNAGRDCLSQTVVTACASGTDAIGIGAEWIANGFCDLVIAGGADELNWVPYVGFIRLMIAGKTACRPFCKDRAGVTLGEGAGVMILESPELAKRRGISPRGWVRGYGNACDGYHATAPEPTGRGLRKAIQAALHQASEAADIPGELAFINAHGTGTPDNDAVEAAVFHALLPGVPVCATKSFTGHTLGAAGAVEAVITLLTLNGGIIPGANFNDPLPDPTLPIEPLWKPESISISGDSQKRKRLALSDSLAFGGCNAALILEKEADDVA